MPIINEELWNDYVNKNKDAYGGCCVNVARLLKMLTFLDIVLNRIIGGRK